MAQEDDRPRLSPDPLDPDRFEKLVRFVHECALVFPVDGRRVVLIQKDARVGDDAWEVFTEPQMALRPRGRAPCVPCMGSGVLASWVQAMDSNDARDVSYCLWTERWECLYLLDLYVAGGRADRGIGNELS